jgi:hypothetical protein
LRQTLASECMKLGLDDLDVSVLQQGKPRRLTQLSSLEVYKAGLNGIYYRSRYGHDLENWALFEPFQIRVIGGRRSDPFGRPRSIGCVRDLGITDRKLRNLRTSA